MWQIAFRTDDAELHASIEHERGVARSDTPVSRSATVLALVLDGLLYRRLMREQAAFRLYQDQQDATESVAEKEQEHDQQTAGA